MNSANMKTLGILLTALAAPISAHASATLQNSSILAGVSDFGTLGSNGSTSPGILFDPTGTSSYGVNDFLTPGSPFEGFTVYSGTSRLADQNNTNTGSTFTLVQNSATSVSATGQISTLGIKNDYNLTTVAGRSVISINTTLTNLGRSALSALSFARFTDPDPDVNVWGSYYTVNSIISPDQACATGTQSGQTICIYSNSTYHHNVGITNWDTHPASYLAGTNGGNGDYTIGIGFSLGDLAIGDSLSFNYAYALGGSLDIATTDTTGKVPEPGVIALLGLGLIGIVATKRRS